MSQSPTYPVLSAERIGKLLSLCDEYDDETLHDVSGTELRSLLSAASRLAETEARCEALRRTALRPIAKDLTQCAACGRIWDGTKAERHAPDCLAAPRTEVDGG